MDVVKTAGTGRTELKLSLDITAGGDSLMALAVYRYGWNNVIVCSWLSESSCSRVAVCDLPGIQLNINISAVRMICSFLIFVYF